MRERRSDVNGEALGAKEAYQGTHKNIQTGQCLKMEVKGATAGKLITTQK